MSSRPPAIVAGHGGFAEGLVSAVSQITGEGDRFVTLSSGGMSPADIVAALLEQINATGARVVFTDLPAGSCTMAVRRVLRERPDVVLVSGANLPALLDFAIGGDAPACDAARRAVERGRAALAATGGSG